MNNDCLVVDELILELADYKNDYGDIAAEKRLRKCSTSWEAYQYLARPRARWLATRQRTSAAATDYQTDTSADTSVS
ncbi:MAG: hypothetical protein ABSE80_12295 [Halobacteriota archaeon]